MQFIRRGSSHRNGHGSRLGAGTVPMLVFLAIAACAIFAVVQFDLFGTSGSSSSTLIPDENLHTVQRERLLVTVTEDGNLESASNINVMCEIPGGSSILTIVADGTMVTKGQVIVELDSATIDDQLEAQEGVHDRAVAAQIEATETSEAAEIAVKEYLQGTYIKDMQIVESNITIAMENLRSSQNVLEHTKRMARKGFATPLQLEADEFAVKRTQLELAAQKTEKNVLEKFTRAKMKKQLEATHKAGVALAISAGKTAKLEKTKLDRLAKQKDKCVIYSPDDGMLVYYKERSRWGSSTAQIEEGAPVRERQIIAQIPKLSEMQALVPVHESKVELVKPGKRASLKVLEREFQGTVTHIANQPEGKSFFQAQVKEYPTTVRIEGDATTLRPGMTAEVEILIDDLDDVLTVPVYSVVEKGGKFFAWVQTPDGPKRRELELGLSNDKMVAVNAGIEEGQQVVLNPRAFIDEASSIEGDDAKEEVDSKKKFGEEKSVAADTTKKEEAKPKTPKFADLDKDGDGKVTSEEMPSYLPSNVFQAMDADSDGSISKSEFTKAQAARKRQQQGGNTGGAPAGGAE